MLFRFFKPKWQSQKSEVRLRAIEELSQNTPESAEILEQLALTDPEVSVRQAALSRVQNAQILVKVLEQQSEGPQALTARERLCALLTEQPASDRQYAIQSLHHLRTPNLLTHIVLTAKDNYLQDEALNLLEDQDALACIIRSGSRIQLRQLAAEKLAEPELIEQLTKETLGRDKKVTRTLRNKLNDLQQQAQALAEQQQRCAELVQSLSQLAQGEYFPQYGAKLGVLTEQWQSLQSAASQEQTSDAESALAQASSRHTAETERQTEAQKQAAAAQAKQQLQDAICDALDQLTNNMVSTACEHQTFELPSAEQLQQPLEEWPENESRPAAITDALSRAEKVHSACEKMLAAQTDIVSLQEQAAKAQSLTERQLKDLGAQCRKLSNSLNWPDSARPAVVVLLNQLQQQFRDQQAQRTAQSDARIDAFRDCLTALATALNEGQTKDADRLLKQADSLFPPLQQKCPRGLEQEYRQLSGQLQEINDWRGYAVSPKKEALCEVMERLIDSTMEPQQRAVRIRELQQQWKQLDATDSVHSHKLWRRFKQAADDAYKPCEDFFNNQKQVRAQNLQQRQRICNELEAYLGSINWDDVNWKSLDAHIKQAKRAWREHSPVDRSPGKKLQTQFNNLLPQLENPLKAYRQENAGLKQAMIDQLQQILDSDDLTNATDIVKDVQQRWKETGATFRAKEQQLWQEFRELCNQVFDHYHQARREQTELQQNASDQLIELQRELDAALEPFCGQNQLGELLHEAEELLETLAEQLSGDELQIFQTQYIQLSQLHSSLTTMDDTSFEALQRKALLCEQLESALVCGDYEDVLHAVSDAWHDNHVLSDETHASIDARFRLLCELSEQPEALAGTLQAQETELRQLCIRLEIALGHPSPASDQAMRMEYQMQRLQQALAQTESGGLNIDKIKKLRTEWLCVPFSSHYPALRQRFEALLASLL